MSNNLYGCLLDMGLASYYGGDKQVRRVAKANVKKVARIGRPVLMKIAKSDKPGDIALRALGSLDKKNPRS